MKLGLRVHVYSFALPDHSPLPVAITFSPEDSPIEQTRPEQAQCGNPRNIRSMRGRSTSCVGRISWRITTSITTACIATDRRISTSSNTSVNRGELVAFNLGSFDGASRSPAVASNTLAGLRRAYDQAKSLGVLNQAYIYGFDECKPAQFHM